MENRKRAPCSQATHTHTSGKWWGFYFHNLWKSQYHIEYVERNFRFIVTMLLPRYYLIYLHLICELWLVFITSTHTHTAHFVNIWCVYVNNRALPKIQIYWAHLLGRIFCVELDKNRRSCNHKCVCIYIMHAITTIGTPTGNCNRGGRKWVKQGE